MTAPEILRRPNLPAYVWVAVVSEQPLLQSSDDADSFVAAHVVDVVVFRGETAAQVRGAQQFASVNNVLDLTKRVLRSCQLIHAQVMQ